LIPDFNLLATTYRGDESRGCAELWMLLKEMGDPRPMVDWSGVYGLIVGKTVLDPVKTIEGFREVLAQRPEAFQALIRVIPVEVVVPADVDKMREAVMGLSGRIGEGESFRVTVEKRWTSLRSREIIEAVAEGIDRRVDLENPDWVVLIEIIGKYAGVSVIRPSGILHVLKERRATDEPRAGHTSQRRGM